MGKRNVVKKTEGEDKPRESQAKQGRKEAFMEGVPHLEEVISHPFCPTEHGLTMGNILSLFSTMEFFFTI